MTAPGAGVFCPICWSYVKGGRWQLRSHQLTSSKCLHASGQAARAREPCEFCGRMLAAGDAWAKAQHLRHCWYAPHTSTSGRGEHDEEQRQRPSTPRNRWGEDEGQAQARERPSSVRWRRRSQSEQPVTRRSESRRREPDWNDPATYFHRDPWEYGSDSAGSTASPAAPPPEAMDPGPQDYCGTWGGPLADEFYARPWPEQYSEEYIESVIRQNQQDEQASRGGHTSDAQPSGSQPQPSSPDSYSESRRPEANSVNNENEEQAEDEANNRWWTTTHENGRGFWHNEANTWRATTHENGRGFWQNHEGWHSWHQAQVDDQQRDQQQPMTNSWVGGRYQDNELARRRMGPMAAWKKLLRPRSLSGKRWFPT